MSRDTTAIRARLDAATRPPWGIGIFRRPGYCGRVEAKGYPLPPDGIATICQFERDADGDFIANAPEDVAWLLRRIALLEGAIGLIAHDIGHGEYPCVDALLELSDG